jgi:uncharacterized protein YaaN involved in tellurite resistance
MSDPISVAGLGLAIPGLVDLLAKTISKLRELFNRWQEADLQLLAVTAQLSTLRAILQKIHEWQEEDLDEPPSFQLVMDLNTAISVISIVAQRLDAEIPVIPDDRPSLTASDKANIVWATNRLASLQTMLQHQITTLNALLAVCSW